MTDDWLVSKDVIRNYKQGAARFGSLESLCCFAFLAMDQELTYEERRLRNIQRNQMFLAMLMETTQSNGESKDLPPPPLGESRAAADSDAPSQRHAVEFSHKEEVSAMFKHRREQVEFVYRFLRLCSRENGKALPSLVVFGADGSGKTAVLQAVLSLEEVPSVSLNCAHFKSIKQLIRSLQYELSVKLQEDISEEKSAKRSARLHSLQRFFHNDCKDVAQFSQSLRELYNCEYTVRASRVVIVFDNFASTRSFVDEDAANALLALSQVQSIVSFVFVATSWDSFAGELTYVRNSHRFLTLNFPPYDAQQLDELIVDAFLRKFDVIGTESQAPLDETSCNRTTTIGEIRESVKRTLSSLCEQALPLITRTRRHMSQVLAIVRSLWLVLFEENMLVTFRRLISESLNEEDQYETLRQKQTGSEDYASCEPSINTRDPCNHSLAPRPALRQIRSSEVKIVIEEMLKLNALNLTAHQATKLRQLTSQHQSQPPSPGPHSLTMLPKKQKSNDALSISAVSVPIRMRCLIVAGFLASHNPKESDTIKFVGEKSRKRKQQSESTGGNSQETFATASQSTPAPRTTSPSKYFPLERLLSMYSHVFQLCNSSSQDVGFGQPLLMSMIASLCQKRLLSPSPHWRQQRPHYASHVSHALADALATSMKFPLNDFLTNRSRQFL